MVPPIRLYVTYPINEGKIMSNETPKIVKTEGKEQVESPPEEQTENLPEKKEDAPPIEYTQVPKETASTFAKRSISIMLEYPIYFALCIVGLAALDSSILQGVLDAYNVQGSLLQQNAQLVSVILTFMGLNLLKVLLVGPLLSMMVVYLGFAFTQNKEVSPYNALNFILRNYKRLFVPFLIAQLCIQIGMVVVIPGVLFMMQYAFVDAVTCIEKNQAPSPDLENSRAHYAEAFLHLLFRGPCSLSSAGWLSYNFPITSSRSHH